MKRILALLIVGACSALAFGALRHQTAIARAEAADLRAQAQAGTAALARVQPAVTGFQQAIAEHKTHLAQWSGDKPLDSQLTDWLLGSEHGRIPESLLPKLSAALGLQWTDQSNYVLVAKSALWGLDVNYSGTNLLSDSECGLLSLRPEERRRIESACAAVRERFADWARANVRREFPNTNTLVRYTIPASPELAQSLTNSFYSSIFEAIGPERAPLLWKYKQYWFGLQLGHFAQVPTTLEYRPQPGRSRRGRFVVHRRRSWRAYSR